MKLSFIVPVYNVEKYIADCLESLVNQDIPAEEYEIICIDDGSTDESAAIVKDYRNKHKNIKLIQQENSGVSSARNLGLTHALGEYVWFIDPDDYIEANCLRFLLESIQKQNADVIGIQIDNVTADSKFVVRRLQIEEITEESHVINSPCLFICKRDMLVNNNITFNTSMERGEDTLWVYFVIKHAKKIIYTQTVIYHYRQNPNSVTQRKDEKSYIRISEDMTRLAKVYQQERLECSDSKEEKQLHNRQRLAVQGALFNLFLHEKNFNVAKEALNNLQYQGLYPYSIFWGHIKPNTNMNHTLINWITLFFPLKWYFIMCYKLKRLIKK